MLTLIIIIVLAIIGTAAQAVWIMDERGKMKGWQKVENTLDEINVLLDAHLAEVERNERWIFGHQPKNSGLKPNPSETELPSGSGACQTGVVKKELRDWYYDSIKIDDENPNAIRCYECGKKFPVERTRPDLSRGVRVCEPCCDELRERGQMAKSDAIYDPRLASTTDRKTVERIHALVNQPWWEETESGWRPLPMEELMKKVK